jgi:quinol-cytochrome oxidoreductase complex cytochrome b subunit
MAHQISEPSGPVAPTSDPARGRMPMPFFPDFALIEAITALCYLVVLLIVAAITEPTLEGPADPTASGYIPRPEWYFMWAFQSLKYFKGESEMIGTFIVPMIAIGLLVALPFLDRRERPRPLFRGTRPIRKWPRLVAVVVMAGLGGLTYLAMSSENPMTRASVQLTPAEEAGQALYDKLGCSTCHTVSEVGGGRGPDLSAFGNQPDANERVLLHFTGIGTAPESVMPGYQLSEAELRSLAAYLLSLKGQEGT